MAFYDYREIPMIVILSDIDRDVHELEDETGLATVFLQQRREHNKTLFLLRLNGCLPSSSGRPRALSYFCLAEIQGVCSLSLRRSVSTIMNPGLGA